MIITITNGKGGTGKTTLTMLLSSVFSESGHTVGIIDRDSQQTATHWIDTIKLTNAELYEKGKHKDYDVILIDTPPRLDSPELIESVKQADIILIVTSPSPADLWTTQNTVETIKKHKQGKAIAKLLFNRIKANTLLSKELKSITKLLKTPALENNLHERTCYQYCALNGIKALNKTAQNELLNLAIEIISL